MQKTYCFLNVVCISVIFFSSILCYMQVLLVTKCLCVLCLFNIFLMLSSWVMRNVYFWNIFVLTECNALNCLDGSLNGEELQYRQK